MNKAKYTYYLKATKSANKPVILKISFGYKEVDPISGKTKYMPLRYDTHVRIAKSEWDIDTQEPVTRKAFAAIEEIRKKAENTYQYLLAQGVEITPSLLKSELDQLLGRKKKEKEVVGICDYIEEKIIKSAKLSDLTIKQYKVLLGKIQKFEEGSGRLTTNNFGRSEYLAFQEECKSNLNKMNAVWGVMKNLKSVLNKIRRDYKHLDVFDPSAELGRKERVKLSYDQNVYFDFDQISTIIDYKPETQKLKNTKLILLTLLFTGCRYSDVFKILPKYEYDDNRIRFRYAHYISEKGEGAEVIVPFLKPLEDAIIENDGNMAYPISDQKFNQYVKDLCKLAELNEEVKITYTSSTGRKKFESKPLYAFVSSHIGRRSFITNFINSVPITLLSKITGHSFKDKEIIFQYNKITLMQNAVLFIKELRRLSKDKDRQDEFPIKLA